ncbi:MAG: hypothetical protein AB7V48_16370 [Sedimentibacter sp.]
MKKKLMLATMLIVVLSLFMAGCAKSEPPKTPDTNNPPTNDTKEPDAVTSASQAPDEATFEQKISKDGNFIIITSKDLTFTKDLTVDGTFTKKNAEGKEVPTRSLALAQYGKDNSVIRYTLTVPKIVINSENTLLEYGTIKGDVYVQTPGFKTKDATIDGNLYFKTKELMDAFKADETTKITGKIEVKEYK